MKTKSTSRTTKSKTAKRKPQPASTPKVSRRAKTPDADQARGESSLSGKQKLLHTLLSAPAGATMAKLTESTGWQAHSVRGCISAVFRKRLGLKVEAIARDKGAGKVYRIQQGASHA